MVTIPVFYNEKMVCYSASSFSPSAMKPAEVVKSWQQNFSLYYEEHDFAPLYKKEIALAHDPAYAQQILDCERSNGFGNYSPSIAASLPYTSGAMLAAAREAVDNGQVAVAPVSGFHHARYATAGGFCTFNGLMIAARWLLTNDPYVQSVGILDLDYHYGDGTAQIIDHLQEHRVVTYGTSDSHSKAEVFITDLPEIMHERFKDCDLLLYQAGADAHIHDPLGGWMTDDELYRRDKAVFKTCKAMNLPVAWNLAGGYQEPLRKVLDIHDKTFAACVETYL